MRTKMISKKWLAFVLSLTVFLSAASSAFLPSVKVEAAAGNPNLGPFTIYDALPAPGQFVNETGFGGINNLNETWDNNNLGNGISLGGFGGSIVFKTNAPVLNSADHPYGIDFTVYGNAFSGFEEPGAVAVAQDDGTGKPGKWYNIAGSEHYEDSTIWDYRATYTNPDPEFANANGISVPWVDNFGAAGVIKVNAYHKHSYYPIPANYPLSQTPFDHLQHSYSGVKLAAQKNAFGYTDTHSNGSAPYNLAGNPYIATPAKGDGIDISWAVDENGLPVSLDSIDFIKVNTAVQIDGGPFGEVSTEVTSLQIHEPNASVAITPNLNSITLTGLENESGSKKVTIQDNVNVYDNIKVNADTIKVTANGTADQVFVNNKRGTVNEQVDKVLTLSETKPRLVRVIAQQGVNEPRIYYLSILKGSDKLDADIERTAQYVLNGNVNSEWQAVGIAQAGKKVPESYYNQLINNLNQASGTFSKVTDYARYSIAISALGYDASSFEGYDFINKITNNTRMINQGVNGPLYSLIALNSGNYQVPENAEWTKEKLLEEILKYQGSDGGFSLALNSASDADMTAMTLIALAPYTDQSEIKTAGERAVTWLSTNQKPHGGYGGESSESVSQAIIGLTSNGIDPTGAAFTKDGINLIDKLLSFAKPDGGFAHLLSGSSNGMATEQALQALEAYNLFANKAGRLYEFAGKTMPGVAFPTAITIDVEGPQASIAVGNANGTSALNALESFATSEGIALNVVNSAYGKYVKGIANIEEATYGGYDGWQYAVKRNGEWIHPGVGIADFELQSADHLLVYYGDFNTQLINMAVVTPTLPVTGQDFSVQVNKESWDWNNNKTIVVPAAGAKVTFGSKSAIADSNGVAVFYGGLATAGTHNGVITQYVTDGSPVVVRQTLPLTVNQADPNAIGEFVTLKVLGDDVKGTILSSKTYKLQENDTAYTILKRELGDKVIASGSGASVYVSAIDGLAEFDRGSKSGWLVAVNGILPEVSAGAYTLKANDVVTWRYTLDYEQDYNHPAPVDNGLVEVSVAVEGPEGAVTEGSIKGATALDALQRLTTEKNKQLSVASYSYGLMVDTINHIESGSYGGYDGWQYAIKRDGNWIYPLVGIAEYELKASDHVLVFYGSSNTAFVHETVVTPIIPTVGVEFTVTVTKETFDWNTNLAVVAPAAGAKVEIGNQIAIADENGIATFNSGIEAEGTYTGVVSQYLTERTPEVVRQSFSIIVQSVPTTPEPTPTTSPEPTPTTSPEPTPTTSPEPTPTTSPEPTPTTSPEPTPTTSPEPTPTTSPEPTPTTSPEPTPTTSPEPTPTTSPEPTPTTSPEPTPTTSPEPTPTTSPEPTPTTSPEPTPTTSPEPTPTTSPEPTPTTSPEPTPTTSTEPTPTTSTEPTPTTSTEPTPTTTEPPITIKNATISVTGDSQKGTILPAKSVQLLAGDTAYAVLKRELGSKVVSRGTGASLYVEEIDGLAEFDRGPLSGWMYSVNGVFPDISAGEYVLQLNDVLAWRYTTDLGKDLGAPNPTDPSGNIDPSTDLGTNTNIVEAVLKELNKLTLPANNTNSIGKVGQTTFVLNAATPMSAAELAELVKLLGKSTVKLSQSVKPDSVATIQDTDAKVKLIVPAGAVKETTVIEVNELALKRIGLVSSIFEFTPNGTVFQNPVYIQIKVPADAKNASNLALVWLDEKTGQWIPIPAVLDLKNGTITGKTTHFTKYAVIDRSKLTFVDNSLISSWAYDAVYRVFDANIMVGVSGSELRFEPKKQMTRAEFATLLINLLGETPATEAKAVFKDVAPGAWYYGAIMRAKELNIIQGMSADTFNPNQAVTREQMAIMIAKAFKLEGNNEALPFTDANKIQESAKAYVNAVYTSGIMQGSGGSFDPKAAVTREMAAVVADKLQKLSVK